jgi:hypothetical protein
MKIALASLIQATDGSCYLKGKIETRYHTPHVSVTIILGEGSFVEMIMPEKTFNELKELVGE